VLSDHRGPLPNPAERARGQVPQALQHPGDLLRAGVGSADLARPEASERDERGGATDPPNHDEQSRRGRPEERPPASRQRAEGQGDRSCLGG